MTLLLNTGIKSAVLCLFLATSALAQSYDPEKIREIINADTASRSFGIVVLQNLNGKISAISNGNACAGKKAEDSTIFNIASCTKTYIATLVLLLQEENKLDIDDPVIKYLSLPEMSIPREVKIRHLLNHTSGLPDLEPTERFINAHFDSSLVYDTKDLFQFLNKSGNDTVPGSRFAYNNIGYVLLGLIAEAVSHQTLEQALDHYIFQRLGLRKTYFKYPAHEPKIACAGYELIDSGKRQLNYASMDNLAYAAGSIYTTGYELDFFLRRLFLEKKLLSENSLKEMLVPFPIGNKGNNAIGLGVFMAKADTVDMLTHTGRYLMGYSSAYACFPALNYSVVILRNNIILDYANKSNLANKILTYLIKSRVINH
jgi:D-alanyl-D-alanine carboxypeptidase